MKFLVTIKQYQIYAIERFVNISIKILFSFALFVLCTLNSSSAQDVINIDSTKTIKVRIDPFSAIGANASDIIEKISYIPLETTKESTFGYIGQLVITEEYFIIFDPITNSILVFTKQGKFHSKIQVENSSRNNEKSIQNFTVNTWTKQIVFQLGIAKTINLYYDYDGKFIKNRILTEEDPHSTSTVFLGPDVTTSYIGYPPPKTNFPPYMIIYVKKITDIFARGLKYNTILNFRDLYQGYSLPRYSNSGLDSVFYFTRDYDYSIYKISPNAIERKFSFIFPASFSLPSNFIYDPIWDKKRTQYLDQHPKTIYLLNNCYQIKDNLIFRTTVPDRPSSPNLIYNLKSGILIDYNHVSPDALSYYLPISNGYNYSNMGFFGCDGENVYTSFSSLNLFKAYETNKPKNIVYNSVLTKYFTSGSKQDNPVLLQIKFKEAF